MTNEEFEKEIEDYWIATGWSKSISLGKFKVIARYFYGLKLNEQQDAPEGLDEAATTYAWEHQEAHTNEVGEIEFDYGPRYSAFKAGAEWAFGQGEMIEGTLGYGPHLQRPIIHLEGVPSFYDGHCQEVIVQIRMK